MASTVRELSSHVHMKRTYQLVGKRSMMIIAVDN
jgi:hypothetical protein